MAALSATGVPTATASTTTSGKFAKNALTNSVSYSALSGTATVRVTGTTSSKGKTTPANVTVSVRSGTTTLGTLTTTNGTLTVTLPADAPTGNWTVSLDMPDVYATTQANAFKIRPANADTSTQGWDATTFRFKTGTVIAVN